MSPDDNVHFPEKAVPSFINGIQHKNHAIDEPVRYDNRSLIT